MSAPTPAEMIAAAIREHQRLLAYADELADGLQSEPDVEPDWNDPDEPGYGGTVEP